MPPKSKSKSRSKAKSSSASRAKRPARDAGREPKKKKKEKKTENKDAVRKITRVGNYTYYVTLPKDEILELGWREHQKVTVRRSGDKLIIEDWKR